MAPILKNTASLPFHKCVFLSVLVEHDIGANEIPFFKAKVPDFFMKQCNIHLALLFRKVFLSHANLDVGEKMSLKKRSHESSIFHLILISYVLDSLRNYIVTPSAIIDDLEAVRMHRYLKATQLNLFNVQRVSSYRFQSARSQLQPNLFW